MKFAEIAFGTLVNFEAILLGVFGFLYSIYAMYCNSTTTDNPIRPRIVVSIAAKPFTLLPPGSR